MSTTTTFDLKRGATFRATFDMDFDLTGYAVAATVSDGRTAIDDLTTRVINTASGWVEIEAAASLTAAWPPRLLRFDLRATLGDEIVQTETCYINVLTEIT